MDLTKLNKILPSIIEIKDFDSIEIGSHFILASGFEDRSRGFLERLVAAKSFGNKLSKVSVINYLPVNENNERNRVEISKLLARLGVAAINIGEYVFDREHPLDFDNDLDNLMGSIDQESHVYVDISSMSKLLILYILDRLWMKGNAFSVIYSEAAKYAPTEQEYLDSFRKGDFGQELLIELQSVGAFEPIIPSQFSGSTPMGGSRALVDFLGFNKRQSIGVAAIVPYQFFIPIISVPPSNELRWRQEALITINDIGLVPSGKRIHDLGTIKVENDDFSKVKEGEYQIHVSTFDYKKTVETLLWIYEAHKFSHYLTIAPFGSKMQSLGIFIFTRLHPETQIVYASPKDFHAQYTEGVKAIYEIRFKNSLELEKNIMASIDSNSKVLENILKK